MKKFWAMATYEANGKEEKLFTYDCCLTLKEAIEQIRLWRNGYNYQLTSAWVHDENNEIVYKENPIVEIDEFVEFMKYMEDRTDELSECINDIFPLSNGQECEIYKNNRVWDDIGDNEIVYIPDICLNDISRFWYGYNAKDLVNYDDDINHFLDKVYTKSDFVMVAGEEYAEELFNSVDWQHPSTYWDENEEDIKENL